MNRLRVNSGLSGMVAMFVSLACLADNPHLKPSAVSLAESTPLEKVGQATAYWAGFIPVYDATLAVDPKTNRQNLLSDHTATELTLCYRRDLSAQNFKEAAEHALPKTLSPEHQAAVTRLHAVYQDVTDSDCYQLAYRPEKGLLLKLNGQVQYQDVTAGFKQVYLGIWLGSNPLSQGVKSKLLSDLPLP